MSSHKDTVTLRIKKKYFDLILSGEKKVEYREAKDFYFELFFRPRKMPKFLKLHYQSERQLKVELKQLSLIRGTDGNDYIALDLGEASLIDTTKKEATNV